MSNRRSIADFPRNEAGLVDEFIGTAYDVVKEVYDNLDAINNVGDQIEQLDDLAKAAVEEAMGPARVEIQEGVDKAKGYAEDAKASADRANAINRQYPFTYVQGVIQYDVTAISGDPTVNTSGMALWVEGALEYAFTIDSTRLFTLLTPEIYSDGAQMRLIINGHFDDTIRNLTELEESFQQEFAAAQDAREAEFDAFMAGTALEVPVAYVPGILISRRSQTVTYQGDDYRFRADTLPFVTSTWNVDSPKAVLIGNDSLREELATPAGTKLISHTDGGTPQTLQKRLSVTPALKQDLIQARLMAPATGFNNGVVDTSIFPGASNAFQGVAILEENGVPMVYATIRVAGSAWSTGEFCRICKFPLFSDGLSHPVSEWTNPLQMGHGADLSVRVEAGQIVLYTSAAVLDPAATGTLAGKGYARIIWRGASTTQADITNHQVIGATGSGHPLHEWNRCTVAVSDDGRYLLLATAPINQAYGRRIAVYDFPALTALADKTTARPIHVFGIADIRAQSGNVVQGMCSNGNSVFLLMGGTDPFGQNYVVEYTLNGNHIRDVPFDGPAAKHGYAGMLNNPLGLPWRLEPEGICCYKGGVVVTIAEGWYAGGKVVTAEGENWGCIATANTTDIPPSNGTYFVRTTKPAVDGVWDPTQNYQTSQNLSDATKTLYYVGSPAGLLTEEACSQAIMDTVDPAAVPTGQGSGATSIGFQHRGTLTIRAYNERFRKYYDAIKYTGESRLQLYDQRYGSDNSRFASLQANFVSTEHSLILRGGGTSAADGPSMKMHPITCPANPGKVRFFTGPLGSTRLTIDANGESRFNSSAGFVPLRGDRADSGASVVVSRAGVDIGGLQQNTAAVTLFGAEGIGIRFATTNGGVLNNRWEVASNGTLRTNTDGQLSLGQAALKPSEIFATTGTINVSDARKKSLLRSVQERELAVGRRMVREIGVWQWLEEIQNKGPEGARLHVGPTVQDVKAIFESEGLDPHRYGMICYDKWDAITEVVDAVTRDTGLLDEMGNPLVLEVSPATVRVIKEAGDLYGFREGQTHALMLRAMAHDFDELSRRVAALEA